MRTAILLIISSVLGALGAPAPEPAELGARAYSCNIGNDACYISCRGGSAYLDCSASYVSNLESTNL